MMREKARINDGYGTQMRSCVSMIGKTRRSEVNLVDSSEKYLSKRSLLRHNTYS